MFEELILIRIRYKSIKVGDLIRITIRLEVRILMFIISVGDIIIT